jgi:predicted nucleic acid-binding protein
LNAYADTSLLISLYGRDPDTFAAVSLVQRYRPTFFLTPLGEAEFSNAIELRVFRQQWTPAEARAVRNGFLSDVGAGVFQVRDPGRDMWQMVEKLSRRHSARLGTRTLDVLHVAAALILGPEAFFTFDERQGKIAKAEGLRVLPARSRRKP